MIRAHEAPDHQLNLCVRNRLGAPFDGRQGRERARGLRAAALVLHLYLDVSCKGVSTMKIHPSGHTGFVHFAVCILYVSK